MAFGSTLLKGLGRGVSGLGTSRKGLFAIGAMAGVAGFSSVVGPATRDAVLEVGLGDKDADRYFTGSKFSGRSLLGAGIGGNLGTAIQMTAPGDFMKTHPMIPGAPGAAAGGALGGGILGAAVGGALGAKKGIKSGVLGALVGAAAGGSMGGVSQVGGITGSMRGGTILGAAGGAALGSLKGVKGGIIGGLAGAIAGTAAGFAAPAAGVRSYMSNNSDFFAQSPYAPRSSRNMMNDLGAAGDIVLGMHNSRRGY